MSENLTDKVIGFMAVGDHNVNAETKLILMCFMKIDNNP